MALAGRSSRRGGAGLRWITVGVVITLLVLLIDASLKSRSPGQVQQLDSGAWVDRALPLIASSTAEGRVIAAIWADGLKTPGPSLASQIDQVAAQSAADYRTLTSLRPPAALSGPAGLLEAALLARNQAAANLKKALLGDLGSAAGPSAGLATTAASAGSPAAEAALVSQAGSDIQVGDQAYNLFSSTFPSSLGVHMPASAWGADMAPYQPQTAQVFLTALQSAVVTTPVHQLKVVSLTVSPAPESTTGTAPATVQVLPDSRSLTVTVVVADTGNQPEPNLTVTASINPAGTGSSSVRDFVSLNAGQSYTISNLGPLNPPQGANVTLTVTVSAPAGRTTPQASSTMVFTMPAPPPPTTTTSSTTTSTIPHK